MKDILFGEITIRGKKYPCSVVNGVRMVNGKPIDDFLASLDEGSFLEVALHGKKIIDLESISPSSEKKI